MQTIIREQFKEIVDVACSKWKQKLEYVARNNSDPLSSKIELEDEFVEQMFAAATKEQLPILRKYLREPTDNIAIAKGCSFSNELDLLSIKLFSGTSILQVLGSSSTEDKYKGRAIWVHPNYEVVVNRTRCGGSEIVFLKTLTESRYF